MPKRKSKDSFEYLSKKLRKLERKIRRKTQCDSSSSLESLNILSDKEDSEPNIDAIRDLPDVEVINDTLSSEIVIPANQLDQPVCTEEVHSPLDEPGTSGAQGAITESAESESILDSDVLEILGIDPTTNTKWGKDIQKDLAIRLEHYATADLTKDLRKELCDKYLIPGNCKIIDAPQLNPEIKAAVSEQVAKRDKNIELKQKQVATAVSCLSETLSCLFLSKSRDTKLIQSLMDASRILCDCQYNDSITRRNFILSSVKKEMKEQLQNTKVDNLLFGENLAEALKAARAINKSGAELKANPPQKTFIPKKQVPGSSKNWKAPFPNKKPPAPGTQKPKEPSTQRSRPSNSYKQSQSRQHSSRR